MSKCYVNYCGNLNLRTGKNEFFNVLDDWDERSSLTLVKDIKGKPRVIGGHSSYSKGDVVTLVGAKTQRQYGDAEVVTAVPCTKQGLTELKSVLQSASVIFAVLD